MIFNVLENFQVGDISEIDKIWNFVEEYRETKLQNTFTNENDKKEELLLYFMLLCKEIGYLIFLINLLINRLQKITIDF